MAGMGTGEESPISSTFRVSAPDYNKSLITSSGGIIDSRRTDETTAAANTEKCPSSFNGTTTTAKCVTIQQFKEEGAPKYAVVERFVCMISKKMSI